jgi:hypothetical protein
MFSTKAAASSAQTTRCPSSTARRATFTPGEAKPPPRVCDAPTVSRRSRSEFAKVKGKATTKQESAKVFERHGSRKRAAAGCAATKQTSVKKQIVSPKAAAHPLISSVFAPVSPSAPGALRNSRGNSRAAADNCSIKSFFAHSSDAEAEARGGASAAAPAAKRTRASTRGSVASGPIKKFFVAADKRCDAVRSSEDIIVIDD